MNDDSIDRAPEQDAAGPADRESRPAPAAPAVPENAPGDPAEPGQLAPADRGRGVHQPLRPAAKSLVPRNAGPDGVGDPGAASHPRVANGAEESLGGGSDATGTQERKFRNDVPRDGGDPNPGSGRYQTTFSFGEQATVGDVAGENIFHSHYNYYFRAEGKDQAEDPIGVAQLATAQLTRAARVHVSTGSDATLRDCCAEDRVVFLSGRQESGRRSSAVAVLDRLTGRSRQRSLVSILETAAGLGGLAKRLANGHGYLLDASTEDWLGAVTEAQVAELQAAFRTRRGGYLIVLVDAGTAPALPGTVVDHDPPDPAQVVESHIAVSLAGDADITADDHRSAQDLLDDALKVSDHAREWYQEITEQARDMVAAPADAAHLAMAIAEWGRRREREPSSVPRTPHFRRLRLAWQARVLLGRGDRSDAPTRQAYVISTAVLDGVAVSEVAEQAQQLARLLQEVEGGSRKRRVFAEPLAYWLGHVAMTAMVTEADIGEVGGRITVVKMPSRELSRTIVEIAWLDYDAAREPLLSWLVGLCGEHRDPRVRIRAAQALAFIAAHDYMHIKTHVLDPWSESDKPIQHQAAAWLLEAAVIDGAVAGRVMDLLRRWSRSMAWQKRAIAVRAYGTRAATRDPDVAMSGIRISAADPLLRTLPEMALGELYAEGLRKSVMEELVFWTYAFPTMRERVGSALVRVSWIRRTGAPSGSYDLLWRMTHEPKSAGIDLAALAGLWKVACQQERSRGAAWKMLGLWALSCRGDSGQRDTFVRLIDSFETSIDDAELRERFGVHRRQWNDYLDQEDAQ